MSNDYDDLLPILRKHRQENFAVNVAPARHQSFPDEFALSITHNGYQWTTVGLMPDEAEKVLQALSGALKRHFDMNKEQS